MHITDVIDPAVSHELTTHTALGIDIGSRGAKAVLLRDDELFVSQVPTGVNMQETANELLDELLEQAGIGCVTCSVGICLLKDVVSIHALPQEDEQALEQAINWYISGEEA